MAETSTNQRFEDLTADELSGKTFKVTRSFVPYTEGDRILIEAADDDVAAKVNGWRRANLVAEVEPA
jgi:hypothetical protein